VGLHQHQSADYLDRGQECTDALDRAFNLFLETAIKEGWSPDEVASAAWSLAKDNILRCMTKRGLDRSAVDDLCQ
jgi:hypothetical protein